MAEWATDADRAANGASLLDEREPDWWQRVNPATLDIPCAHRCVLAQVYGSYANGRTVLRLDRRDVFGLGFEGGSSECNDAWRNEIARRRLAEMPKPDNSEVEFRLRRG